MLHTKVAADTIPFKKPPKHFPAHSLIIKIFSENRTRNCRKIKILTHTIDHINFWYTQVFRLNFNSQF